MIKKDLVVIGGGCAGMAAAIKAHELGIKDVLIIEKSAFLGGILDQCIHNGFGLHTFKEELTGPEFMTRYSDQVKKLHIQYRLMSTVLSIDNHRHVIYTNSYEGLVEIEAKAIINTTGCYEKNAGSIQLAGDRCSGIFTAGQAQHYLNNFGYLVGKRVFILGSGDIGLIMARRMALEGATILGVAEINQFSAGLNRNIVQCLQDLDIPLYLGHTVKKVVGRKHLEKIILAKVDEKYNFIEGSEKEFEVDTLLLSVGLVPNVNLLSSINCPLDRTRGPIVNQVYETDIPGIFAAGNALHVHDLVDYVVEEAADAAVGAYYYIRDSLTHSGHIYDVRPGNGINYVVPQKIYTSDIIEKVSLKFRVKKPCKNINIVIRDGDEIIKKVHRIGLVPSGMEIVEIKKDEFHMNTNKLHIELEENL